MVRSFGQGYPYPVNPSSDPTECTGGNGLEVERVLPGGVVRLRRADTTRELTKEPTDVDRLRLLREDHESEDTPRVMIDYTGDPPGKTAMRARSRTETTPSRTVGQSRRRSGRPGRVLVSGSETTPLHFVTTSPRFDPSKPCYSETESKPVKMPIS